MGKALIARGSWASTQSWQCTQMGKGVTELQDLLAGVLGSGFFGTARISDEGFPLWKVVMEGGIPSGLPSQGVGGAQRGLWGVCPQSLARISDEEFPLWKVRG